MLKRLLFVVLLAIASVAQAAVYSLPWGPKPQFVDANGAPMSGGTLLTFIATSSTPQVTYTDSTGGVANPTTITLNTRGETPNEVWLTGGVSYKFVLKDSAGATVWTVDNVSGVNDVTSALDEWKAGPTPTFVSGTSFTLVGDQTTTFTVGRRLKFTVSAGTVYGRITVSAFAASTTVTMQMDGAQVLDSGLSVVSYALLASTVKSEPERIATAAGTDTYTATVGIARYVVGDEFKVKIANQSTSTTPTLNLDLLGAKTIVRPDGTALLAGQLKGEHLFRYDGTNMVVLNPGIAVKIQTFTSSGTYTPTVGMKYAEVTIVGGGGAGGGSAATGAAQVSVGAGGGAGGASIKIVTAAAVGASQTVTVGTGGVAASGTTGGTGVTSSFGAIITATGGVGGNTSAVANQSGVAGSVGGAGSSGDVNLSGGSGSAGVGSNAGGNLFNVAGSGGASIFGSGGTGAAQGTTNGSAGVAKGSGGGGGVTAAAAAASTGGAGADGICIVKEFFNHAANDDLWLERIGMAANDGLFRQKACQ